MRLTLISCAAINGVDPDVVARSEELVLLWAQGADMVASCAEMIGTEADDLKAAVWLPTPEIAKLNLL